MALITTDRVKENASVVGFGDAVLIGSPAGFQTFSSVMDIGDTCYYSIVDTTTGYWETGIGTLTSVNLLQRTAVKTSSFDDDKVSFTDGDKTISLALTSDQFLNLVADTLTQSDITSLVDARYVQLDNNIAQSVTGSGTFGVASSSGIYEASAVWDYALGVESSYSDDAYISTFNLRSNQSSWTVQDLVSSQNINVVLTSTSIDLFYNGNYTQTGNSLLTRSMMDARYQAVGDYLNTTWNGNVITGQYGGTGVANTGKTITIGGNLTTSGAFETTLTATANTSVILPTTGTLATLAGSETFTNKTLSTNTTWNGNIVTGQYGGTGIANTGKTITIGGNLTTSGAFTTTLASTANTSVTLPTTGTLATLDGSETFTNKTLSTNTTWNGNVLTGQYGGTGVANTGRTITIGGNLTTSGAFDTTLTATANTSVTLPTTGALATLDESETLTNKTLSTNTTWNGNIVTGQYGGTGVANTGKTITIGGNLTTTGAFTTAITSTANTNVTLPTTGTLATLDGSETFTNKTLSTNVDYNGNIVAGQYGGTGVANTGKTITIGGNLTTSGAFTTTLTATANTSVTLPTTGTLATLAGTESFSNKYITTGAGNTTVAGLILTSGTNTTAVANGSIEFDNVNFYFSVAGARKTVAYLDSNLTGTWSGTVVAGQYGGTGIANTGKTITIGGNLTTSGAFTTTLASTANTSVTLPTTGTLATLAGPETFTNKTLSTNTTWNGNVITGQYGGTGVANTGKTITIGGNLTTSGSFDTSITITAGTSITLPTAGTLATLAGSETLTNKTLSTNTTWNGNVITGQYGGTGVANTGKTITIGGNLTTSGAFTTTLTSTANTSVTLPITGTLATLAGTESFSNKYITTGAGNTTVAGLVLTSGTNTTAVANGSIEFDNVNYYFSVAGARKVNAYLDSNLTGTWSGTVVAGQYGGTGIANTGKTITIGGNLTTSGAFTTTLTSTANTSVTLPTTGTLATLAGSETFTNKTLSTNVDYNGNVIAGQYGGTGVANTGKTITIGGNLTTSGAFDTTLTATAATSVTLPTTGTLATLAGIESLTNKTLSDGIGFINTLGNNFLDLTSGIGIVSAWGLNGSGTLGDGTYVNKSSPVQLITSRTNWSSVATGGQQFSAGVKQDGTLWAWGLNNDGQLGDNTINGTNSPVQVITGGTNWKQVSCGYKHTAAIKTDGTLWTWGINNGGQLGDNTTVKKSSPIQTIAGGTNWSKVSCGVNHTGAIKTDGTLWSWGTGTHGALGDNSIVSKSSPVQTITGGNTWREISCGYNSCGAIKTDGTLWVWGYNQTGAVGDGTATNRSSPVQTITGGTNWSKITKTSESSGLQVESTAAIKTDGTLWTWGGNDVGQLGDNTIVNKSSPVQTIVRGYWSGVFMGGRSTIAIEADGTLWAWGRNNSGQLGDNTTVNKSSPVQTIAGGYKWVSAAISDGSTLAISANPSKLSLEGNLTTSGAFTTTLTATANTSVTLPTTGTLSTLAGIESLTNKTMSTNTTWNGNVIPGQYGGTGIANTGFTLTMAGNISHTGAFAQTFTATGTTSVTLPTTGTLATLAGSESFTNKTLSTNSTWNGNVIAGQYGGTGVANTGKTITIGGNLTTSGAFTTTLTSTANTSVILPTTGTLATLAGTETLSNKTVNLVAGNATTAPLKFVSGTNMTAAAAGNMEFDGTRLYFSPSTTRQTVAFLTDLTGGGGLTVADDTTTNATRYLIFTNATSGSVSTANTSSSKLYFNPSTGDLTAGGSITALSDRTLKNNITTITGAVDKVNSMRGVEFDWIESGGHGIGMIAQEVEDIIPEVVLTHKGLKSVAYGNLIAVLIEAIKDQDKRIKLLEALVERLVK